MTWIIVGGLASIALFLIFSLLKKFVKLVFTALALVLVSAGIWYYSRQDPEVAKALEEVGERAGETLERVTEEALEKATESAGENTQRVLEHTREILEEDASKVEQQGDEAESEESG